MKFLSKILNDKHVYNLEKSIIHEDLTLENILLSRGEFFFIDFGESHYAETISDIPTAIKEIVINHKGANITLIRNYIEAYNSVNNNLSPKNINLIVPLMRRRTLFMLTYFLNKQKTNKSYFSKKIDKELKVLYLLNKDKSIEKGLMSIFN